MREVDRDLFRAVKSLDLKKIENAINAGANVNAEDNQGRTPLHHAVFCIDHYPLLRYREYCIVRKLIEEGANVNATDKYSNTILHYASELDLKAVEILVEHGADVNAKNSENCTPLHFSLSFGKIDIAEYLVWKGADLHVIDDSNKSILHYAASYAAAKNENESMKFVRFLLESGFELDVEDKYGHTPLSLAVLHGNYDMAVFLAQHGANPYIRNIEGKSAMDFHYKEKWKRKIQDAYFEYNRNSAMEKLKNTSDNIAVTESVSSRRVRSI